MWSTGIKKANKGDDAGFTLIELLIVMGIVAVVSLAAIPAWQQFNRTMTLRGAALQLASLLRYAQLNAVETSEERYVYVDFMAGTYRLQPLSRTDGTNNQAGGSDDAVDGEAETTTSHWEVTRFMPPSVQAALLSDNELDEESAAGIAEDQNESEESSGDVDSIEVEFRPDGSASPVSMELVSGNLAYRIEVRGATGVVHVEKTRKE